MTEEAKMEGLAECPFCGWHEPQLIDDREWSDAITWTVACQVCGANFNCDTEAEAIAAWNTRPASEGPAEAGALADRDALDRLWDGLALLNDRSHPAWAALAHVKNRLAALRSTRGDEALGLLSEAREACFRDALDENSSDERREGKFALVRKIDAYLKDHAR